MEGDISPSKVAYRNQINKSRHLPSIMGSDAGAIERAAGRDVLIGDGSRFHAQSRDASTWSSKGTHVNFHSKISINRRSLIAHRLEKMSGHFSFSLKLAGASSLRPELVHHRWSFERENKRHVVDLWLCRPLLYKHGAQSSSSKNWTKLVKNWTKLIERLAADSDSEDFERKKKRADVLSLILTAGNWQEDTLGAGPQTTSLLAPPQPINRRPDSRRHVKPTTGRTFRTHRKYFMKNSVKGCAELTTWIHN